MNNIGDKIYNNNIHIHLKLNFYINDNILHKNNNIWNNIAMNIWININNKLPNKRFNLNNIV
jgi:hypothetical protein